MFTTNLQQELLQTAVLRHVSFYPVTDTSSEWKCVLSLVWAPSPRSEHNLGGLMDAVFVKERWRRTCDKYLSLYNLHCDWMIDLHPDYCRDKFSLYCYV